LGSRSSSGWVAASRSQGSCRVRAHALRHALASNLLERQIIKLLTSDNATLP
jgi:hypothetical protein